MSALVVVIDKSFYLTNRSGRTQLILSNKKAFITTVRDLSLQKPYFVHLNAINRKLTSKQLNSLSKINASAKRNVSNQEEIDPVT